MSWSREAVSSAREVPLAHALAVRRLSRPRLSSLVLRVGRNPSDATSRPAPTKLIGACLDLNAVLAESLQQIAAPVEHNPQSFRGSIQDVCGGKSEVERRPSFRDELPAPLALRQYIVLIERLFVDAHERR